MAYTKIDDNTLAETTTRQIKKADTERNIASLEARLVKERAILAKYNEA